MQKLAVDTIDGPLLVLAGPGTGKTQLLSVRAASILERTQAKPDNILILTYTNPAAKAMKERVAVVVGPSGYDVEVGTFHSFANSMLQESAEAANYIGSKILMDDVDQVKAIEFILNNTDGVTEVRPFRAPNLYIRDLLSRISTLKKDDISPEDFKRYLKDKDSRYRSMEDAHIKRLEALSVVYERYEDLKEGKADGIFDDRGRYDFDDMIIFAVQAIRKEDRLRKHFRDRYRYIMVDEYQDTNGAQLDLLFELSEGDNANICCVGDDDQSIYRFQGANIDNFRRLEARFPNIKKLSLTENYRSSDDLITASRKILNILETRVANKEFNGVNKFINKEILYREFTTEEEELLYVIDKVKELKERIKHDASLSADERAHPYNSIAVLVRKRDHILKIVDAFLRSGIPYATDGKEDIGQEKRVSQLLDVLELARIDLVNPEFKDAALYKVLMADYFMIPHVDVLRFINYANEKKRTPGHKNTILTVFLEYFSSDKNDLDLSGEDKFKYAYLVIQRLLSEAHNIPVHTLLINFIKDAGIFKFILREYADTGTLRMRQLRSMGSFINMVKRSDLADPAIRLSSFLSEMDTRKNHGLSIQGNLVTLSQEGVRVYTAHGSKGLEFRSVLIPFCIQNKNWPARPLADKIPLPFDVFKNTKIDPDKETIKRLSLQDEARLFYVAITRAKSDLILTSSPTEDKVPSSYLDKLDLDKAIDKVAFGAEEALIGKTLEVTDEGDPFTGTESVLKDMISSMTLNPTRLNNYITCPRKFLYNDILKLPGQKKTGLVFGNCVHKALEDTYKEFMHTEKFPSFNFFRDAFRKELRYQGIDSDMERDCLNKMNTLKGWYDVESKSTVMPIALEEKLTVTIGDNIIFTGKYDKVEWFDEKRGLVRILDYKTGKPDDHVKGVDLCRDVASTDCDGYLRQLAAYKLLFEKSQRQAQGRRVGGLTLVFIEPVNANIPKQSLKKGDHISKQVVISDDMVRQLESVIIDVWNKIKGLHFERFFERDKEVCKKCDFDDICWR